MLLLNDLGAPVGGAERSTLRLRALLRARGHEVRLLTSRAAPPGFEVHADATCAGTLAPRRRVLLQAANVSAAMALRRELTGFRPDVVHARMLLSQLSPLVLPLLRDVPSVYHAATYEAICPIATKVLPDGARCGEPAGRACHRCLTPQSWVLDMGRLTLWRRWSGVFDAVLALSATQAARLAAEGVGPARVVPNAVEQRPARPPLTGPPTVGFAGRLVREKGADVLLRAFARLDVPDARLLVAGDGPERPALATLAHDLGIADRVELTGHLDRAALERRLDAAWVQAVPGRWEEPFGNVALEAMMRGTAVVATALGGPAELVAGGRTGTLVPPEDPVALAAALRRYLTAPAVAEQAGAQGRATALAEYTEARLVERVEAIHTQVVAAHPGVTRALSRSPR